MADYDITKTPLPPTSSVIYNWFHHFRYFHNSKIKKVECKLNLADLRFKEYALEINPEFGFELQDGIHGEQIKVTFHNLALDRVKIIKNNSEVRGGLVLHDELLVKDETGCELAISIDHHALQILGVIKGIDNYASLGAQELCERVIAKWPGLTPVFVLVYLEIMTGIKL